MIVVMDTQATRDQVESVQEEIKRIGFRPFVNPGVERKVIAVLGELDVRKADLVEHFQAMPGVARVDLISDLWKLASRSYHPDDTVVEVGDVRVGGTRVVVTAGPCSVESQEQTIRLAHEVKTAGATMLRGGAFKPRTSPYSFQGLGEDGLRILAKAREETGLPVVTEVMDTDQVDMVCKYADVLQIGARNMQNFALLKKVGSTGYPVLLKRGLGSKIKDLLMSAEYIISEGNHNVILCERGITTFERLHSQHHRYQCCPGPPELDSPAGNAGPEPCDRQLAICGSGGQGSRGGRRGWSSAGGPQRPLTRAHRWTAVADPHCLRASAQPASGAWQPQWTGSCKILNFQF